MTTKLDLDKVRKAIDEYDRHGGSAGYGETSFVPVFAEAARAYLALVSGEPSEEMVKRAIGAWPG